MSKSESIKELATALSKAQMMVSGAKKDSNNPFFKSTYADLSSVVEAIKTAFGENGLSFIQTIEPSDKDEVRVQTVILHSSGEWFSCGILALPVSKHDAQGFGSALTYARRYSLSAAVGVAPEDDDGNGAAKAAPKKELRAVPKDELPPRIPHMAEFAIADHLANIQAASDMESLQKAHESAKKAAEGAGDVEAFKRFKAATASRKAILNAEEMAGAV